MHSPIRCKRPARIAWRCPAVSRLRAVTSLPTSEPRAIDRASFRLTRHSGLTLDVVDARRFVVGALVRRESYIRTCRSMAPCSAGLTPLYDLDCSCICSRHAARSSGVAASLTFGLTAFASIFDFSRPTSLPSLFLPTFFGGEDFDTQRRSLYPWVQTPGPRLARRRPISHRATRTRLINRCYAVTSGNYLVGARNLRAHLRSRLLSRLAASGCPWHRTA